MNVNITDIEDAVTYRRQDLLDEAFNAAEQAINDGDTVVLQRKYANADPDTVETITTVDRLNEYRDHYNDALENGDTNMAALMERLRQEKEGE